MTLFLLIACAPQNLTGYENVTQSPQPVQAPVANITPPVPNVTVPAESNITITQNITRAEPKPIFVDSSKNMTLSSLDESKLYSVKGKTYTIEVVDVTEAADACLIKVDGALAIIDEGETKTVDGVRIFVSEVHAFRSQLEDKDVCQIIIS